MHDMVLPASLKAIARAGAGYDDVDVSACTASHVALAIASDAVRRPTAVAALTLILAAATRLIPKHLITLKGAREWGRRDEFHSIDLTGKTLGLVGLGSIGIFMARRLARVGFEVTGCDISPDMLAAFDEPGSRREADPIATARSAEILGICVRTDEQLEALAGDGKLFAALGDGGIAVIHSTVAPELAQRLAKTAAAHGVGLIDAGVSPGGPHVGEGRASIFTGGADADVARARPYLEALGRVAHLGPIGRGLEGKLLNNLVSYKWDNHDITERDPDWSRHRCSQAPTKARAHNKTAQIQKITSVQYIYL